MNFSVRRQAQLFDFVLSVCGVFVILSALAMLFYPGGSQKNPLQAGYSFSLNFFSDLGRARAHNGESNSLSSALFTLALIAAGLALASFFVAFAAFFRTSLLLRVLALLGAISGVVAGAAFIGVALVGADRNNSLHGSFVLLAFRAFFGAVLPFAPAILLQKTYPRSGAWIFLAFAALLAAYIALISVGPGPREPGGLAIQVVGQKIIVYASIASVAAQSCLARAFLRHDGT